jgi:endonuclease-3
VASRKRVDNSVLPQVLNRLRRARSAVDAPIAAFIATTEQDPYRVLTGCILSLRTQDRVTAAAAERLFALAPGMEALARSRVASVERAIYPVGFYRTKARRLVEIATRLVAEHGGRVPDSIDDLLELPGVGRKTANLVVTVAYRRPGICVDTHVHRITNRWGYVATRNPDETERRLREVLPRRYWIELNGLLVAFGQTVCRPTHPRCGDCAVVAWCARVGVAERAPARATHKRVTVR